MDDFDSFDYYQNYDLLISNMSIHWSRNYLKLIQKILNLSKDLYSFCYHSQNSNSFNDLKIDQKRFTNKFPNMDELKYFLKDSKICIYNIIKKVHIRMNLIISYFF